MAKIVIDKEVEIAKLADMLENLTDDKDKQSVRFAINVIEGFEEKPHGKWIRANGTYYCSCCKHYAYESQKFDFCQDCGADMRGEDDKGADKEAHDGCN